MKGRLPPFLPSPRPSALRQIGAIRLSAVNGVSTALHEHRGISAFGLAHQLPLFIDLMMDNPDEDWAMPMYPSIDS